MISKAIICYEEEVLVRPEHPANTLDLGPIIFIFDRQYLYTAAESTSSMLILSIHQELIDDRNLLIFSHEFTTIVNTATSPPIVAKVRVFMIILYSNLYSIQSIA